MRLTPVWDYAARRTTGVKDGGDLVQIVYDDRSTGLVNYGVVANVCDSVATS